MGDTAMPEAGQQHLRALESANRVRLARAELKRQIADGALTVGEVVLDGAWQVHSMQISDLLMSQKRWGHTRCRRLLMSIGVPENKAVGTLTERQRRALVAVLAGEPVPADAAPAFAPNVRALSPA
jgi:hypothetical protein